MPSLVMAMNRMLTKIAVMMKSSKKLEVTTLYMAFRHFPGGGGCSLLGHTDPMIFWTFCHSCCSGVRKTPPLFFSCIEENFSIVTPTKRLSRKNPPTMMKHT